MYCWTKVEVDFTIYRVSSSHSHLLDTCVYVYVQHTQLVKERLYMTIMQEHS